MRSRAGALAVARRAHRHLGVPWKIALYIAFAARKEDVRYALAFALFEQESDYEVIYGNDAGGLFPGQRVTKQNFRQFRAVVVAHEGIGANGVGLGQVTYWTYIRDHKRLDKPRVQVYLSMSIFAALVHHSGERTGAGEYNGGPGNPVYSYAEEVLTKAQRIRPALSGRRGK